MRMDLGTRNTLLYDFMHCMTAVSLEMSDEPKKRGIFVEKPLEKESIGNVPRFLLLSPIYIYRPKNSRKSKNLEIHSVWFGTSTEYD